MTLQLTGTDLFCGAGGSSLGLEEAGVELRMAANHWNLAIETHADNFPGADHDCADVSQIDPRRYPRTDILLASPECTTHSLARSHKHEANLFNPKGDPRVERSRATMWDVPRFAEHHHYEIVVVENVVEIRRWPPFNAWLEAMAALGYKHRIVYMNSMVAWPTPQSRDRFYAVFWKAGNKAPDLEFPVKAWCPACDKPVEAYQAWKDAAKPFGKYRQQYLYRCRGCHAVAFPYVYPAAAAIDWSLPAPRIGDRVRPLAPATLRRIAVGLERFGAAIVQKSGQTFERRGSGYYRVWSTTEGPMPAQTTDLCHGLVVPVVHADRSSRARPTSEPGPTQTGRQEQALVTLPFLLSQYDYNGGDERRVKAISEPLPTVVAEGSHHWLAVPPAFLAELRGGWSDARSVGDPIATVTANGNHHALVVPYHTRDQARPVTEPLPTQDTHDRFALVLKNYGDGGVSVDGAPGDGAVTTQDHHSVVELPAAVQVVVDDCGFRMLEPHEIQAAMAFPRSYRIKGSKRDKVRQAGNAVTPPVMTGIVGRAVESLS